MMKEFIVLRKKMKRKRIISIIFCMVLSLVLIGSVFAIDLCPRSQLKSAGLSDAEVGVICDYIGDCSVFDISCFYERAIKVTGIPGIQSHAESETMKLYPEYNEGSWDSEYRKKGYTDTLPDAFRHSYITALYTNLLGGSWGLRLMEAHEAGQSGLDSKMDLHNNAIGKYIADTTSDSSRTNIAKVIKEQTHFQYVTSNSEIESSVNANNLVYIEEKDIDSKYTNAVWTTIYNGNWGDWKDQISSNDGYACGAQVRFEDSQGGGDDTAMNGLKLNFCSDSGNTWTTIYNGNWGSWKSQVSCPNNYQICGAQVRFEDSQGGGDDTAMNGLKIKCCDRSGGSSTTWKTVYNGNWGSWKDQVSSDGYVCGAQVRFEDSQGGGDDTAMNGLRFKFC